jgi:hypothetical protein
MRRHFRQNTKYRNQNGSAIVELGASLFLWVIAIMVFLAGVAFTLCYVINGSLAAGARQAARDIAVEYGKGSTTVDTRAEQNTVAYDNIRINGIITSSSQFSDAVFTTVGTGTSARKYVTVKCTFTNGQSNSVGYNSSLGGYLNLPNVLSVSETYRCEGY